jgi:plastocyanin
VKRLIAVIVVAVAAAAMLTQSSFGADRVSVTARDFRFTLSKSSVRAGTVTFTLTNRGNQRHDFKIGGRKTSIISRGRTATVRVRLRSGRSYTYICTVPGHASAGMKGRLRVR